MKIPDIIPVTDLRQDAAAVFRKLQDAEGPLVVTQRGRAVAVIQSVEAYEKSRHELELLRQLTRGEREIAADEGHDLRDVMSEADDLLGENAS